MTCFLQEKQVEPMKQKGERRKKPNRPNPEEREGMPQHHHCPPARHHDDKNPEYHEEQTKDVTIILSAHPLKASKGNISRSTKEILHANINVKRNNRKSAAPMPRKRRNATKIARRLPITYC
jgi:hypothetical protein